MHDLHDANAGRGAMIEPPETPGFVHLRSEGRATATAERLEGIVRAKGLTIFSRIDFASAAAGTGLTMPPMIQLAFGNPKSGTPLVIANPAAAVALPLRAVAWEDADGHSWLSYESPEAIIARFALPAALLANIAGLRALCEAAAAPG
jgi:uncharacterized protein (DUF302 family)